MKISNEIKVGLFTVIGIVIVIIGHNYIKGRDLLKKSNTYFVRYQRVEGLSRADFVRVNGFKVGRVDELKMLPDNSILASFYIESSIPIPKGTSAKIVSLDFLGEKAVDLLLSDSDEYHAAGDTLVGLIQTDLTDEIRLELLPVKAKIEDLFVEIEDLISVLTPIIRDGQLEEGIASIKRSFDNVESITLTIDSMMTAMKPGLEGIVENVDDITRNFAENEEQIEEILSSFATLSDSLANANIAQTIAELENTLVNVNSIMASIESGEGTLGKMLKDEGLYNNLEESTQDLEDLLTDLKENPDRYVHFSLFGGNKDKKDKKKDKE